MRDAGEEDAGVHVGGDAYGGVKLTGARTRKPGKSAKIRRRNLVIAGAMSGVVLAGSGVVWATTTYGLGGFESVDAGASGLESTGAMNILLVGVDKRDDLSRRDQNKLKLGREVGERTDTMMLIHLSEDHRKVTVVSLPRDTWTTVPGQGQHKINSAYQFGGPKLTVKTVQEATGVPVNMYVEVNVLGFIDVIDALKGVTVCTAVPINDQKLAFALPAGTHQLDGVRALAYARTRSTARSDFDRIDRQQQVISAMLDRALSSSTLANPATLGAFVKSVQKTIKIDPADNLVGLAGQLRDTSLNDVKFVNVPIADVDFKTPTGESAVLWDKEGARELFRRITADEDLVKPSPKPSSTPSASPTQVPPQRVTLKVLNGTLITGLGARTKTGLLAAGFQVPDEPGNTSRKDHKKTIVRYGPGREDAARTVAAAIPGSELRQVDIDGIEVIVGSDQPKIRKLKVTATPSATPTALPSAKTATQNICQK